MNIFRTINKIDQFTSQQNTSSNISNNQQRATFFDKILYFIEYLILIVICFLAYSFFLFFIAGKMEALGLLLFIFYLGSFSFFNLIFATFVFKDVKKLQLKGVNTNNTAWGWATIVFFLSAIGFSWYLALRRADYKKQITTV